MIKKKEKRAGIKKSFDNRCHGISSETSDDDVNVWDSKTSGNRKGKYARKRGERCMYTAYMHEILQNSLYLHHGQ